MTLRLLEAGPDTLVVMEEDVVSGPGRIIPRPVRSEGCGGATWSRCGGWRSWPSTARSTDEPPS